MVEAVSRGGCGTPRHLAVEQCPRHYSAHRQRAWRGQDLGQYIEGGVGALGAEIKQ